jgi:hypothetical protein
MAQLAGRGLQPDGVAVLALGEEPAAARQPEVEALARLGEEDVELDEDGARAALGKVGEELHEVLVARLFVEAEGALAAETERRREVDGTAEWVSGPEGVGFSKS